SRGWHRMGQSRVREIRRIEDLDHLLARQLRGGSAAACRIPRHRRASPSMSSTGPVVLDRPLVRLFEEPGLSAYPLPQPLIELYGGPIGFPQSWLYANFVASIDGIVALEGVGGSLTLISGG